MQHRKKLTASFRRLFLKGADPRQKQLFARWFGQLDLSHGELFSSPAQEKAVEQQMEQKLYAHFHRQQHKPKILRFPFWKPAVAAAILIIVGASLWLIPKLKNSSTPTFAQAYTTSGQRKLITLPDGSKIILGNSSSIKYPAAFTDTLREVFLEGEAFFDIVHDKQKPFRVKSGKLDIQVLGTSFNIRNYATDQTIDVVVASGKVGVSENSKKKTWMLMPGNLLSYHTLTGNIIQNRVNPNDYTGWQKGELIFNNEPLEKIFKRLERWYGVRITIKNASLTNSAIRLKMKNESLQTVLKTLATIGDFNYKIQDKNVQIWQ